MTKVISRILMNLLFGNLKWEFSVYHHLVIKTLKIDLLISHFGFHNTIIDPLGYI